MTRFKVKVGGGYDKAGVLLSGEGKKKSSKKGKKTIGVRTNRVRRPSGEVYSRSLKKKAWIMNREIKSLEGALRQIHGRHFAKFELPGRKRKEKDFQ